jgi:hypothetical protein
MQFIIAWPHSDGRVPTVATAIGLAAADKRLKVRPHDVFSYFMLMTFPQTRPITKSCVASDHRFGPLMTQGEGGVLLKYATKRRA